MIEILSSLFVFKIHGLLNIAAAFLNLTLGMVVYLNNPKSSLQRSYFYFALSCFLWIFCYGIMTLVRDEQNAPAWLSNAYTGVAFIPPTLYAFSQRLLGKSVRAWMEKIGFFFSVVFWLTMAFKQSEICAIQTFSWGRFNAFLPTAFARSYFYLFILFFSVYIISAYFNFIMGYRSASSPIQKKQFRNILIGFSIGYLGMLDFGTTIGWEFYPPGYLALTILTCVIAYSVIRHQLWDINLAFKRVSIILLIYVFLIGFSVPLLFPVAERKLSGVLMENIFLFVLFSALFGFIFSTGPFIYAYLVRNTFWLKKHITTGLTHELKSPIGAIRGSLDLLTEKLNDAAQSPREVADYLRMIDKNVARLENYVKDLLHVAKAQEGQVAVDKKDIDLAALARATVETYRESARQKNLHLQFESPPSLRVAGDGEKLEQVLSNILSNAVKYSDQGEIRVSLFNRRNEIHCVVTDEGRGIRPADIERVFERFYQGPNSAKGSGIGLSIAKAWVEAHGGKIWAESEGEGKGTKVTFTLPIL